MNRKWLTYPLILIVSVIWGKIIYDLTRNVEQDVTVEVVPSLDDVLEPQANNSFELILDYKDPFITHSKRRKRSKTNKKQSSVSKAAKKTESAETKEIKKAAWPALTYKGMLKNNHGSAELGVITIKEKTYLMAENDIKKGLELLELFKDSVRLKLGDEELILHQF